MRIRIRSIATRPLIFFACLFFLAPLGCSAPNEKGTLEVRLKDDRRAIGDFSKAEIGIESIRLSPKVGPKFWQLGWWELSPSPGAVDLTKLVKGLAATIFEGEIDSGAFEALDLRIRGIQGFVESETTQTPVKNTLVPVTLPFSVNPKEVTLIILDLTIMDMSDHPPRGYELQLEGYEVYNNGKLVDKVPPG